MSRRALLVVDVQVDFCEGGALAVSGGTEVAGRISSYLRSYDDYDVLIATRDLHVAPGHHFAPGGTTADFVATWPAHCVAGTDGADYHPDLVLPERTAHVVKGAFAAAYSGFEGRADLGAGPATENLLREAGVSEIDVVGIAESHCVRATAVDGTRLGFAVRVVSDLTVGVSPETTAAARAEMRAAGVRMQPSPLTPG